MDIRDLFVLFACGLSVLLWLQDRGLYSLNLACIHQIDTKLYRNNLFADETEKLPAPLVTDLDGDGVNDIVVVTRGGKISVLDTSSPIEVSHGTHQLKTYPNKHEGSLLSSVPVLAGRRPVALQSGYLTSFDTPPAKQVIAVLLEEWTLLCFDHTLKLLWEANLQDEVNEVTTNKYFREAAISIVPDAIYAGDRSGSIVVGGRLVASPTFMQSQGGMHEEYESHFSYVAVDGATGHVRWHHSSSDFLDHEEANLHELKHAQINYKLSLQHSSHHSGEKNWRQFRKALLGVLPHRWQILPHTLLFPAHILPDSHTSTETAQTGMDASAKSALLFPTHNIASVFGGFLVDTPQKTDHANVVVTKAHSGIEVIHFFTGRTVCQMPLTPHTTHADINDDGVIDHIITELRLEEHPTQRREMMYLVASSGMPPHSELFATPLRATSSEGWLQSSFVIEKETTDSFLFSLSPLPAILPRIDATTGKSTSHVVALKANGVLFCVSPTGNVVWQIVTGCQWDRYEKEKGLAVPAPSLEVVRLSPRSTEYSVVVTGLDALAIVSQDGELVSSTELEAMPVAPPLIVDITNDGILDIIVETPVAYYGFEMTLSGSSIISKFVFGMLLLGTAAVVSALLASGAWSPNHSGAGLSTKKI